MFILLDQIKEEHSASAIFLSRSSPQLIPGLSNIRTIRSGIRHVVALTSEGRVYTWGSTAQGIINSPFLVEELNDIIDIQCGGSFSIALDVRGRVFSWGENKWGQLGLGDTHLRSRPKLIKTFLGTRIFQISCGYSHVIALSNKGEVFTWGSNKHGELGAGEQTLQFNPVYLSYLDKKNIIIVDAISAQSFAVDIDGKVLNCGINTEHKTFVECGSLCLKCKNFFCVDDFSVHICLTGRMKEQ